MKNLNDANVAQQVEEADSHGNGTKKKAKKKSDLSPAKQWLVERMRKLGYGRIKKLHVVDGEPVMEPPPKICRRCKLTGKRSSDPIAAGADFLLKQHVVSLFEEMETVADGVVAIEVCDGLPFDITIE